MVPMKVTVIQLVRGGSTLINVQVIFGASGGGPNIGAQRLFHSACPAAVQLSAATATSWSLSVGGMMSPHFGSFGCPLNQTVPGCSSCPASRILDSSPVSRTKGLV